MSRTKKAKGNRKPSNKHPSKGIKGIKGSISLAKLRHRKDFDLGR